MSGETFGTVVNGGVELLDEIEKRMEFIAAARGGDLGRVVVFLAPVESNDQVSEPVAAVPSTQDISARGSSSTGAAGGGAAVPGTRDAAVQTDPMVIPLVPAKLLCKGQIPLDGERHARAILVTSFRGPDFQIPIEPRAHLRRGQRIIRGSDRHAKAIPLFFDEDLEEEEEEKTSLRRSPRPGLAGSGPSPHRGSWRPKSCRRRCMCAARREALCTRCRSGRSRGGLV